MDSYQVDFKPSVERDFREIPRTVLPRILKKIGELKEMPLPLQARKLSMAERLYRIRVGDYRIVYEVDLSNKLLIIHYIRHRRRVYRELAE
jgi:mRNA interferase RelE/StbE